MVILLQDDNIKLLPLSKEHQADFIRLANIPEINNRINKPPVYKLENFAELLASIEKSSNFYVWVIEKDGRICGAINTSQLRNHKIFQGGYWVDPQFQGKNIASSALLLVKEFLFNECGAERIQALVEPDNTASIRVLEKCGYEREGLLRKFHLSKTKGLIDVFMYSVVK